MRNYSEYLTPETIQKITNQIKEYDRVYSERSTIINNMLASKTTPDTFWRAYEKYSAKSSAEREEIRIQLKTELNFINSKYSYNGINASNVIELYFGHTDCDKFHAINKKSKTHKDVKKNDNSVGSKTTALAWGSSPQTLQHLSDVCMVIYLAQRESIDTLEPKERTIILYFMMMRWLASKVRNTNPYLDERKNPVMYRPILSADIKEAVKSTIQKIDAGDYSVYDRYGNVMTESTKEFKTSQKEQLVSMILEWIDGHDGELPTRNQFIRDIDNNEVYNKWNVTWTQQSLSVYLKRYDSKDDGVKVSDYFTPERQKKGKK